MWGKIIELLFPLGVTIIQNWIKNNNQQEKAKKAWLDFLQMAQKEENISVKMRREIDRQMEKLKEM